jgi:hypothetical protein
MRRVVSVMAVAGLLCMAMTMSLMDLSASTGSRFALMETGEFFGFMGDDGAELAPPPSGELWLGLFPSRQGYELRPTRLTVSVIQENLGDGPSPNPLTTTHIAARSRQKPIFLLKTGGRLSPGPVPTAFAGELLLEPDKFLRLSLGERDYLFHVQAAASATSEEGSRATLMLEGRSFFEGQLYRGHPTWYLLWAGDLDRDGKLDLYLELGGGVGGDRRLFLSSAAKKNEAVGLAASFLTLGC